MSESDDLPLLVGMAEAIASGSGSSCVRESIRQQSEMITLEIERLSTNDVHAAKLLLTLVGKGLPTGHDDLVEKVARLAMLCSPDSGRKLATHLLVRVYRRADDSGKDAMLFAMSDKHNRWFWTVADWFDGFIEQVRLCPTAAARWFLATAESIGSDGGAAAFWNGVKRYAELDPAAAAEIVRSYVSEGLSGSRSTLASILLGSIRASTSSPELTLPLVEELESLLRTSRHVESRLCYHRSWVSTFDKRPPTPAQLGRVLDDMMCGTPEEVAAAFQVLTRCMLRNVKNTEIMAFAFGWIKRQASSLLPSMAKYCLADLFHWLKRTDDFAIGPKEQSIINEVIAAIQPIPSTDIGTWVSLVDYAVCLLKEDPPAFETLMAQLASSNPDTMIPDILGRNASACLWQELVQTDCRTMVLGLLFSDNEAVRRLGRRFFDNVTVDSCPQELATSLTEKQVQIAILEYTRQVVDGNTAARFFLCLEPRVQTGSRELQHLFKQECLEQAISMPGACLDVLKQRVPESSLIREVVTAAEQYFDKLKQVRASPVNSFGHYEITRACTLASRKMSRSVEEGVKKNTLLGAIAHTVTIIYGDRWATQIEGRLGPATDFKQFSAASEWPRLPCIDPEGQALKALEHSSRVRKIEGQ